MTKSALRVLEIMEYIAVRGAGSTHAQIAEQLGIPKSSLTALMRDLQEMNYVRIDEATGRYELDSQCLVLSQAFLKSLNIVRAGQPVVHDVFSEINEFTALAIPKDCDYIIVCAETPASPLAHSLQIGERGPLYCSATGKAILAFVDEREARRILETSKRAKLTPTTKTDVNDIVREYAKVRALGCAFAREESIAGITACAVPIFNSIGQPVAALSCALPTARINAVREKQIIAALKTAGEQLSEALGWRSKTGTTQTSDRRPRTNLKSSPARTRRSMSSSRSL